MMFIIYLTGVARMQAIQRKGVCCPVGIRTVRKDRYGHTAKRIGYCFFILKFS